LENNNPVTKDSDPMTDRPKVELVNLVSNVLEGQQSDMLKGALSAFLHALMDSQVTELCGAAYGERSPDRTNSRNGTRSRPLETRLGTIELEIPKLREGSYLPPFVEPRRRWERAFVNVVAESYVSGVSTRKVESLVEAMGAQGMSKSEVSRMAAVLDAEVEAFRKRTLEGEFPYLWLDAMYLKVREGGRIVSKAVLVAFGVNGDGQREVLGLAVTHGEMERCWRSFLASLVERGLSGVQLVISDAHQGLRNAIAAVLTGTTWQRCYVHFLRDVSSHLPKAAQGFALAALRNAFQQTTLEHAQEAMTKAIDLLEPRYPTVAELVREAEHDVLAYFGFPEPHRRQIRSTNPLERLNKELRRRTRVVGIFPTDGSVVRLVGMLLVEQHEEWTAGDRRYFSVNSMKLLSAPPKNPELEDRLAAK
jgi:transposase-like protein